MTDRGRTPHLRLLTLVLVLLPCVQARPFQCQQLQHVTSTCSCEGKMIDNIEDNTRVVLNCRNIGLSSVPKIQGSSSHVIYEMTLAQNNIQTIPAAAFSGLRIQRLDLRQNRLTTINTTAFQDLENDLLELYLGAEMNASIAFPIDSFTSLVGLQTLHLEYFKFSSNGLTEDDGLHRMSTLTSLTLRDNKLEYILPATLPTSLTSLTLDSQSLPSLPIDILRSLTDLRSLTVTHTPISTISNNAFQVNTRLTSLDLGYNQIRQVNNNCFNGITTSLEYLSLQNNPISSVTDLNEIQTLTALTSLQLSQISLTSLPADAQFLMNKASLHDLHLEGNSFTTLGANVFTQVSASLQTLNLARNQLSTLNDQSFTGLSALTSLDLSHQTISPNQLTLPASLTSLTSLKTLKLSDTRLNQAVLWQRISNAHSLQTLHLDGTSLTTVSNYALMKLTQLRGLHLDRNALTEVTQEMLAGPRGLTTLTLNNNQIETVSNCTFHDFLLSPALSLELISNPLKCDCKLDWLLVNRAAGKINLSGAETCSSPADKNGRLVTSYQPGQFTCPSSLLDAPCLELYTTAAPPSTGPPPALGLTTTSVSNNSIIIQWTISNFPDLDYFRVKHMDLETSATTWSQNIDVSQRSFRVQGLLPGRVYSVCITAYSSSGTQQTSCLQRTTLAVDPGQEEQDGEAGSDTGLIVGVVIGMVALLVVVALILYLVFLRKRPAKSEPPVQPHTFSASELPGMGANTKQFTRPKEKHQPKVGRALDENIKVTVISDGHTGPTSPGGRHSAGSYQFLDEKHPNPNPAAVPKGSQNYSNDVDSRPLPTAPADSMKGYYNNGFRQDTPSDHTYNEIDK